MQGTCYRCARPIFTHDDGSPLYSCYCRWMRHRYRGGPGSGAMTPQVEQTPEATADADERARWPWRSLW